MLIGLHMICCFFKRDNKRLLEERTAAKSKHQDERQDGDPQHRLAGGVPAVHVARHHPVAERRHGQTKDHYGTEDAVVHRYAGVLPCRCRKMPAGALKMMSASAAALRTTPNEISDTGTLTGLRLAATISSIGMPSWDAISLLRVWMDYICSVWCVCERDQERAKPEVLIWC